MSHTIRDFDIVTIKTTRDLNQMSNIIYFFSLFLVCFRPISIEISKKKMWKISLVYDKCVDLCNLNSCCVAIRLRFNSEIGFVFISIFFFCDCGFRVEFLFFIFDVFMNHEYFFYFFFSAVSSQWATCDHGTR